MLLKVLPTIPKEQRTRVAHFLEKQGFKQQALAVSSDPEHRFELAIQLSDLKVGPNRFSFAEKSNRPIFQSKLKIIIVEIFHYRLQESWLQRQTVNKNGNN